MLSVEDVHSAADQLADRAVIRAKAVDAWVGLALEQPHPEEWANALVAAALDRLTAVPEKLTVKAEARLQLLDIQRAIHAGITSSRTDRPGPVHSSRSRM
jgi:hypothetical protein